MKRFTDNWPEETEKAYEYIPETGKTFFTYPIIKKPKTKREFDVVVIGGGPNGLTCAAYLARAGLKVAIVDRRTELGGAVATEELRQPGFRHNTHAVYMPMVDYAPVYKDLELESHHLEHVFPEVQFAMSFKDGNSVCIYNDIEKTVKSFEKFSKRDASVFREFYHASKVFMDEFIAPTTYAQPLPAFDQLAKTSRAPWSREMMALTEKAPLQFVNETFESEQIRSLVLYVLCMWGADPAQSGVGYLIPLYINRSANYRLVVHGSHALTAAISRDYMKHGGKIFSPYGVEKIVVEDGKAKGVQLSGGPFLEAGIGVVSTVDPHQTFFSFIGEEHLDEDFINSTEGWMWDHWSLLGVHMCMLEAPLFRSAEKNPDVNKAFIHVLGYESTGDFMKQQAAIKNNILDETYGFNCCFPSIHDPSQAPAGKHTGLISCMAPFDLAEGSEKWLRYKYKEEKAWMFINKLAQYAPNINEKMIRDIYVSTPRDVSNKFLDMVRGSIKQGQYHPLQMGYMRPNEHCSTHRSPIRSLYMGGASTYPGGTVILGSGYLAADAVAEDAGIKKWWHEPHYVKKARENGYL